MSCCPGLPFCKGRIKTMLVFGGIISVCETCEYKHSNLYPRGTYYLCERQSLPTQCWDDSSDNKDAAAFLLLGAKLNRTEIRFAVK